MASSNITKILINDFIDHTLLKPTANLTDINQLCEEAKELQFYAVCVNGCFVKSAVSFLADCDVKVASVVGFPLGASSTKSKLEEAVNAVKDGADEIDMVVNIGAVKSGDWKLVKSEIEHIKSAIGEKVLKVIIETCYLTDDEKIEVCKLIAKTNADFVKTSTGFGTGGATLDDIKLMKSAIEGSHLKIKASGGIKDLSTAQEYISLGVERIGTSSGVLILKEFQSSNYKP